MANKDDRTEKPTAKRRQEARKEGQVARSQDVATAVSLVALVGYVLVIGPDLGRSMQHDLGIILENAALSPSSPEITDAAMDLITAGLVPALIISIIVAVVSGGSQTRFRLATKAAKPKFSNLSLKKGVQNLSPTKLAWELARTVLKVGLLVAVSWGPVLSLIDDLGSLRSLTGWVDETVAQAVGILIRAAALAVVIAVADYAYNRWKTEKGLKMSKQDIKDEARQTEGDPTVKGRIRAKARELSRNRMISAVSEADVVIVNPVRFAVALRYVEGEPAPRVVAKGAGRLARKIRTEAYRHGVPVRQDPPLARALYRQVQVGQFVPAALYEAVAVVLAAVYRRRWQRRRRPVGAR